MNPFIERFLEGIWLGRAFRRAAETPDSARAAMRELDRAIQVRRRQARALLDRRALPASVALLREALILAISARSDPERIVDGFAAAGLLAAEQNRPKSSALALEILRVPAVDPSLASPDLVQALDDTLLWLERGYEPRTIEELRIQRALRMTALGAILAGLLVFEGVRAFSVENVAYGKPVALSSHRDATSQPSTFVDGKRRAHTTSSSNQESTAWARIDLRGEFAIQKVVVYNGHELGRENVLPLVLEFSDDGKDYREVGIRDTTFTDRRPWVVKLPGEKARYVRLRIERQAASIALSEVEVYGRRLD